jgi:hypothetical protein
MLNYFREVNLQDLYNMKDLQLFLNNIIDIFTTKKSLPNDVMNDFIKYFYFTLDKEIKSNKSEVLKNKYIKIRKNGLYYIVANKEAIMANIRKKKLSK